MDDMDIKQALTYGGFLYEKEDELDGFEGFEEGFLGDLSWLIGVAGMGMGVYHGYKRNHDSIGWALGWGLLGGMFPVVVIPLSLAQGFGKPKGAAPAFSDYQAFPEYR